MKYLNGKQAVLYRRVSTSDQKDYGNSLSTQSNRLNEFCNKNSIDVIKDFEEDFSAKDFNRPVFSQLLKFVSSNKNQVDLILISKWDRFSRNTMEALTMIHLFKGFDVEVNCSDQWINHDEPNQLLMLLLNLGMPEADNRIRRDRTIEGTRSNLKAGRWVYSQPKGYLKGKDKFGKVLMKPNPKIAHLIKELFTDFSLGVYSQNEIRKLPKYKTLNLTKSGLSRILNQIAYSGQIKIPSYKEECEMIVDSLHKPLVSKEIFEKVQIELGNRKRIKHKPSKQNDLLPLRGFLKCAYCGANLTGSGSRSKTGKKHYYYHCNGGKGCKERFRAAIAHERIDTLLKELEPNQEVCNLFELILKDKFENSEESNKFIIRSINKKIALAKRRKQSLLTKFLDEDIEQGIYKSNDKELSNELSELENQKAQLSKYENDTKKFIDFGIYVIKNLGSFFKKATVSSKQKILSSIFKEKLVFEEEKYRTPTLNKGIELITKSISVLQDSKNKNGRQSFDYLPLCTRDGT